MGTVYYPLVSLQNDCTYINYKKFRTIIFRTLNFRTKNFGQKNPKISDFRTKISDKINSGYEFRTFSLHFGQNLIMNSTLS